MLFRSTGKVLHAENATYPWYPASVTKILTAYITLTAVKSGRLSLDSLIPVSARAAAQAPSKMGFKPGTQVTIDNALKMLFVKSANEIAYVLAEGVGGSIEKFADEMNATSRRLGMTQSHWVNPNGLPADEQVTSARKFMLAARAAARNKPVIVIKAGRGAEGAAAAASHTGALAGADEVYDAAIRRAGMLRVEIGRAHV